MPQKETQPAGDIAKSFEPSLYEDGIYKMWEESGFFNPDNLALPESAPSYCIVMPPPNVTGTLHMGHAAMLAIEDILVRYHRLRGERALWVPGTDHAAIATQTKVEKIIKEEGLSRHGLGREVFLGRVRQFAQESHDTIVNQVRKMGSSCDWSREAYTLDEIRTKAVRSVFKMMYDDGLIYRGDRVVNWCPRCHSTLADDEVEHKAQKAKLYTFKYSKDFPFAISTTRPETKLGDTAVAVNPKDERYQQYIGQTFEIDFCGVPLKLKIIADRGVEMEFGTGALGVTPAHSMVDWQMARENDLSIIKVIDEDGNIHPGFADYSGKTAKEARRLVVERLAEQGLIEKEEEIDNNLSICYRCGTPIEPLPSLQWFIDVNKKIAKFDKTLKELAVEAVRQGVLGQEKISIVPERFEKNYFHWMENLQDWCISRQIWFGHQVPVWYRPKADQPGAGEVETYVGVETPVGEGWAQDEDTLDTWFSSGLWTFTTLAKNSEQIRIEDGKLIIDSADFKYFHPTAVLETGYDILFFWVARMIIMTTYAVGDIPFKDVYLHGLVRDDKGKKMSKSLGNVIDPLDMIAKYGTDATRLSLVIGSTPGNDMNLSEEKIAGFRNLTNKIWNIARYIITSENFQGISGSEFVAQTAADKWVVAEFHKLIANVTNDLDTYAFSQAGERLREFTWDKLADWYLEASKFERNEDKPKILKYILENLLILWHPFMPFVTEQVWQEMGKASILMLEKWPTASSIDNSSNAFESIVEVIKAIRNARSANGVEPAKKIKAVVYAGQYAELFEEQSALISGLRTGIDELEIKTQGEKIEKAIFAAVGGIEIYLIGALDEAKEKERISKEIENLVKVVAGVKAKLDNKEFVERAPAQIIEKEKEKLATWGEELSKLKEQLERLQ